VVFGDLSFEHTDMEITLPPDAERFIQEQVQGGKYASADEIVLTAIQLLKAQDYPRKHLRITPATEGSGYADTAIQHDAIIAEQAQS
jgi:putative addiction module CopG family antidote